MVPESGVRTSINRLSHYSAFWLSGRNGITLGLIDYLLAVITINLLEMNCFKRHASPPLPHRRSRRLTLVARGAPIGRLGAVAHVAVALLDAAPPVVAEAAGAAAVARAAGADARRHLGPLLQVEAGAVDGQRADAAQEASLLGRRSP